MAKKLKKNIVKENLKSNETNFSPRSLNTFLQFFSELNATEKEKLKSNTKKYAYTKKVQEGNFVSVIKFLLGGETYAIEVSKTVETIKLNNLTPLPKTPAFILGLVNLRGRIIAVVNLKIFFELKSSAIKDMNQIIVLRNKDFRFGILTDEVLGIGEVNVDSLTEKFPTLDEKRTKYLKGVTPDGLIFLDADKIANDPALVIETEI
jgi:chemotaxis signal transduction protein